MRTIQNDTGLELGYFWCQREPGEHRLTFVLKGTFTIAPGEQATMAAREARDSLSGDVHHDDGERLVYPSDFAPWKPRADVIVSGNAAAIKVGTLEKSSSDARGFDAIDRRESARACLAGTYDDAWLTKRWPAFPSDFDWGYFNAAPRDQQIDGYLAGDESIAIADMPDAARIEAKLPALRPRLFVRREAGDALPFEEVLLSLDTLWLGADREKLVLVWRGSISVRDKRFREVEQLLLAIEPMAAEPLPRAHYATEERWVSAAPSEEEIAEREEQAARAIDREDEEDVADDEAAVNAAREVLKAANASPALIAKLTDVRSVDELMAVLEREDAAPDVARAQAAEAEAVRANRRFQEEHADELAALQGADEQAPIGKLTRAGVVARLAARDSLHGLDLSALDLSNLDLSGADLEGANLRGSSLDGSLLAGARLVGADLSGVWAASRPLVLTGADLTGATLDNGNLPGLIALGVDFTRASLRRAKLAHAKLMDSILAEAMLEAADLTGADLSRSALSGAMLAFATLPAATLCECDFAGANLVKANLEHTTLDGASFEHASLEGVSLHHAHGDGVSLRGAGLAAANAEDAQLAEADFGGASCDRARFDRAILRGAAFERADGEGVSLRGAALNGLRATGASFPGLQADGAHAPGAIFCGADLAMASFVGATLDDADFSEANLTRARLHRAMLKNANLMSSKLAAADLTSVNLFRGQLEGADLTSADCSGSNLFECELYEATLEGARFDGCNLKRTKLDSVDRASTAVRSVA
jgi:uncharacterized protein YjbI with pentapeptide repeats